MKKKFLNTVIFTYFFYLVNAFSAPMFFSYSINTFYNNDSTSLIELSYQFAENGLKYTSVGGMQKGNLLLEFSLKAKDGRIIKENWESSITFSGKEDNFLTGLKIITAKPSSYNAKLKFIDANNLSNSDSVSFELNIRDFNLKKILLSDVQLATEISQSSDEDNIFYKNGLIVIPNIMGIIEPPMLVLNTYLEVYNPNLVPTSEYVVVYSIADSNGKIFYKKEEKKPRTNELGVIDVNSFPLEEIPSGKYFLVVTAFQGLLRSASDSSRIIKPFFVVNPTKDSTLNNQKNELLNASKLAKEADPIFMSKTEKELDIDFKKTKYIMLNNELEMWKNMQGKEAKARFLTYFWGKRNPNPSGTKNEVFDDYYKRLAECKKFSCTFYPEGWESDRGRIYMQLGKPSSVEKFSFKLQQKPYEVWTYDNTNWTFVFIDKSQTGTFALRHSTHPDEIHNEDWFNREVYINTER